MQLTTTIRTLRRLRRCCVALVAATVLVLPTTTLTAGTANSAPAAFQDFDIWNLTAGDLAVDGYEGFPPAYAGKAQQTTGLPAPGTKFSTGKNLNLRLNDGYGVTAVLVGRGGAQKFAIQMGYTQGTAQIYCAIRSPASTAACGNGIGHNVHIVADGPNTKVDVPPQDTQKQATMFNDMCIGQYAKELGIGCDYTSMDRVPTSGDPKMPIDFDIVTAGRGGITQENYETKWKSETTTTVELSASVAPKFLEKFGVAIAAKYSKSTIETLEVNKSLKLTIPPLRTAWLCASLPKWTYTGTLVVTAGNTTWTMPGVTVVTPRPEGPRLINSFFTKTDLNKGEPDPCPGLVSKKIDSEKGPDF